jgi:hypothetical protein
MGFREVSTFDFSSGISPAASILKNGHFREAWLLVNIVSLAACRSETPEALSSKQLPCKSLIAVTH